MLSKRFFKTKDEVEVTFEYPGEQAEEAVLLCEANNWEPIPMQKGKSADSPFRVKVRLPKDGEFQFRYLLDGSRWDNDWSADAYAPNEHGGDNSIVRTFSEN